MSLVGLTGGIGMGKSTIAAMLRRQAVSVVDTDEISRELTRPNGRALPEIRAEFGPSVFTKTGELDRAAMAKVVFEDPNSRMRLERILHPMIRQEWMDWSTRFRPPNQGMGVVVIPLLFETNVFGEFDQIICVKCRAEDQTARLHERGWTEADIVARNAAQWPIEQKVERSDVMVWTSCTKECTEKQLLAVGLLPHSATVEQ